MAKRINYYCVGVIWNDTPDRNRLPEFIDSGIWETGYDDKYYSRINNVPVGSRIAAKTTYTEKRGGVSTSILEIHATGTVTHNPGNGTRLVVNWDPPFEPYKIPGKGGYRATISRIHDEQVIERIFQLSKKVNIYSLEEYKSSDPEYPCFIFIKDNWNDYGFKTLFEVEFFESANMRTIIGPVKVLQKNEIETDISKVIGSREDDYCSLGGNNNYYEKLRYLENKELTDLYLEKMNDLAINRGLVSEFESITGFSTSLLRNSESQKSLNEGGRIYNGITIINEFDFTFESLLGNAEAPHSFRFDFRPKGDLPYRIKVLIGRNGTGKTTYLANLASTLSGFEESGKVLTKYLPPFSRVIAISYSLFDKFPRPQNTRKYSYFYSGFQGNKSVLSENQIESRIKRALSRLHDLNRMSLFERYLSTVLSDELASNLLDDEFENWNSKDFRVQENGYSKYSSGQLIMILILSEVLSIISENSLLLLDEPETHLHPNSTSLFIQVINGILEKFDSYAIISTHSPQVVQEVPAKDVLVIDRTGNIPSSRTLGMESFGENLNTITQQIFSTINNDEFYRKQLQKLSKTLSYDDILKMFEENSLPLGFGAKIFLQSQYK